MNISVFIEQKSSHFTVYSEDKIISSAPQGVRNKWKTRPLFSKNLLGIYWWVGFPGGISGKESACHCRRLRDTGLIPGSGRRPWVRKDPWVRKALEEAMATHCSTLD